MKLQEIVAGLHEAEEQLFQAELRFDQVTNPELIDAAIYEQKAWQSRCKYYRQKLREAVKSGQTVACKWDVCHRS